MRVRRQQGFTLLEIIIVVLVFSIMSVMAYGGLNSVLRTRTGIQAATTQIADMQRTFLRLRSDFQNLRRRSVRDSFGELQPAFALEGNEAVNFVRGGKRNPAYRPRSSMERVRYELVDGELRRASWRVLDAAQETEPESLPLIKGVSELSWRFLDETNEWRESWPSAEFGFESRAQAPPPRAVEMVLLTDQWGELKFVFRTGIEPIPDSFGATATPGGGQSQNQDRGQSQDEPGANQSNDNNGGDSNTGLRRPTDARIDLPSEPEFIDQ